jgi:hypothetical protein
MTDVSSDNIVIDMITDENYINSNKIKNDQQLPWVEKYRPSSLSELIAHEEIIAIRKI